MLIERIKHDSDDIFRSELYLFTRLSNDPLSHHLEIQQFKLFVIEYYGLERYNRSQGVEVKWRSLVKENKKTYWREVTPDTPGSMLVAEFYLL